MNQAATAYESRKSEVGFDEGQKVFTVGFAIVAFEAGNTAGPGRGPSVSTKSNVGGPEAYKELARCCLAYVLAHENAHHPEERRAYLVCVRRIRDGAREIMAAADEMAAQLFRHHCETGELEAIRATTLLRLADALHGDLGNGMEGIAYAEKIAPLLIDNPFSGHNVVHGLNGCAALFNEADYILEEHTAGLPAKSTDPRISIGMRTGNKTDVDTAAFIIDLADLFTSVIGRQPTANDSASGAKSPFVRFVAKVFEEIKVQRTVIVGECAASSFDQKAYAAPSPSTLKNILKERQGNR